jgi:phosphatidylglycerol:prolipoprotein diacylglycerol transferase
LITKNITIVLIFVGLIYFFSQVFSGSIILPQSFSFGPLTLRYYGLFMAFGVAAGFYLAVKRADRFGLTSKEAEDILFWVIVGGFIGSRLYHVLSAWMFYYQHPFDILKVWNGGLSIYGAVLGGVVSLIILNKVTGSKLSVMNLLNWLTPSLVIGQIVGRFGNFFNYELFGYPSNLPWKMFVPERFRPELYFKSEYFHPLFLYEQIGLIGVFLVLRYIQKQAHSSAFGGRMSFWGLYQQSLFLWYVLLYNILRIPLEFLRIESVFIGSVRQNALVSFILFIISAVYIFKHAGSKERFFN